jgi:hypothetical protein
MKEASHGEAGSRVDNAAVTPCLQIAVSTCGVAPDQGCHAVARIREAPQRTGVNGTLMARQSEMGYQR